MTDLAKIRRRFAEALRNNSKAMLRSSRLVDAFARIPRERLLGEGPWKVCRLAEGGRSSYEPTAISDPAEVYEDVLIAIDAARGLNNRSCWLHASGCCLSRLEPEAHDAR